MYLIFLIASFLLVSSANGIYDGKDAPIREFPYHVSISLHNQTILGGSIISQHWLLTTHNIKLYTPTNLLQIRSGSDSPFKCGSVHNVDKLLSHEKDLVLVRVGQPFVFNGTRQPIELPESSRNLFSGDMVNVTGFGLARGNVYPKQLQMIQVPVLDLETRGCSFSAGFEVRGIGNTCYGDTGGPVVRNGRLVGVVSGSDCSSEGYEWFVDVSCYRDWIVRHIFLND